MSEIAAVDAAVSRLMERAPRAGRIDLSLGQPDQPVDSRISQAAVDAIQAGRTGYTPKLGDDELRAAVAEDIAASTGYRPEVADVVITIGGTEAVAVAIETVCGAQSAIAVPDPAWPNYRVIAGELGIPVHAYGQGIGDDFIDLVAVERALRDGARLVVVNSPSNPTGAVASAQHLARLADLVRAYDAWILSDEAYESIVFRGGRAPSPLSVAPDRTFSCRTFSKTYAMTGWRVGTLVAPAAWRARVAAIHGTTVGCAPAVGQAAALAALREVDPLSLAPAYAARWRRATDALAPWIGEQDAEQRGGFYLWLDVGSARRPAVLAALDDAGVLVSTGEVYSPGADGALRIALTAPDAELDRAVAAVRGALE